MTRLAAGEAGVVAQAGRAAVLAPQAVAVDRAQADRERVLLGAVGLQRVAGRLGVEALGDLRQIDRAEHAALRSVALRDGDERGVGGVGAERVLEHPVHALAVDARGRDRPAHGELRRRLGIDVRVPLRRRQLRRRRQLARHHHLGRLADVGPAVAVLRRPVGVRVARPLPRGVRRLGLRDHRRRRVHHHLLDLVGRERARDDARVARVEPRRRDHRQHRRHERRRTRGRRAVAAEDVVRPVRGHARARAEPRRELVLPGQPVLVVGQRVARDDVVEQVPVGVVHRVEVVGVQRERHAVVVGVVDGLLVERRVRVGDDDGADRLGADVGRVEDRLAPLVRAAEALGALLDGDDTAVAALTDSAEVVVRHPADVRDQAGGVAVGGVLGLRVVRVAVEVPARDVVDVAVVVVVAVVRQRDDEVLRRQVRRLRAGDVHGVEVVVLPAGDAGARRALLVLDERRDARRARRVDARVVLVVAQVEVPVAVGVVTIGALRERQLSPVEEDLVQRVLDPVRRVVDAALDVRDDDVGTADVPLAPRAGEVHT